MTKGAAKGVWVCDHAHGHGHTLMSKSISYSMWALRDGAETVKLLITLTCQHLRP